MRDADEAILSTLERAMLDETVLDDIVERAVDALSASAQEGRRAGIEKEIRQLDTELARFVEALASGGELTTVIAAIRSRETRREALQRELGACLAPLGPKDVGALRAKLAARVRDWRNLLRRQAEQGRQLIQRLVVGRFVLTPEKDADGRFYRFHGTGTLSKLFVGLGPQNVASPTGTAIMWSEEITIPV